MHHKNSCKLSEIHIFKELDTLDLSYLESEKSCSIFKKGQSIFQEESYPRGVFCVHSGKVKLSQRGIDGKEQIVHLAKAGDIMGYRALLSQDIFNCSGLVLEDAYVSFIPKKSFMRIVESNIKLTLQIVYLLAAELKATENKITHTAQMPVSKKILQSLISLIDKYGFIENTKIINANITREELGNLAGTSRETATRVLYKLQDKGYIKLDGKKIHIETQLNQLIHK